MTFNDVVEVVKNLSSDEKHEMQLLLKQYLREERRDEIYKNFDIAQVEQQKGELKFSSNIKELRQLIEEWAWKSVSVLHSNVQKANQR